MVVAGCGGFCLGLCFFFSLHVAIHYLVLLQLCRQRGGGRVVTSAVRKGGGVSLYAIYRWFKRPGHWQRWEVARGNVRRQQKQPARGLKRQLGCKAQPRALGPAPAALNPWDGALCQLAPFSGGRSRVTACVPLRTTL